MTQGDERDLILGLLLPRVAGVTPEQMAPVLEAWSGQKEKSLPEVCVEMGVITAAQGAEVESRADEIIRRAGGNASRALHELLRSETRTELPVPPPAIADRYAVIRDLPQGGLGWVGLADDRRLKRQVVVKQIKEGRTDALYPMQFEREVHAAAALEHPNIVPVYDAGTDAAGRPFYVMRYIPGDSLKQAIARHHPGEPGQSLTARSLALRDLLGRFVSVCEAVAFAHSKKIVHRDIKPANIMVGSFGEAQLIDWGLVKVEDELGVPAFAGTSAYKAPEQAEGADDRIGPSTDVYGLGATLYHILVGRPPFPGEDCIITADVIRGIFPRPRQVNPEVAPALEAICIKAMARDPADRYPSAKALAGDVERWLADEPVGVYRDPWTKRVARFAKRHRTAMTAVGAVAATAVMWIAAGYVIVSGQLAETERARMVATRSRDELAMNVQETMEVIDTFLLRMAADEWARFPGSEAARRDMAEKAVRKLQDIQSHSSEDNGLLFGIARAKRFAGLLAVVTADHESARKYFDDSHMLLAHLIHSRIGDDYRAHDTFANLLLDEADLAMRIDGPPKAISYLETARDVSRMVPPERFPWLLGRVAAAWGDHLLAVERWDEAVEEFEAATRFFDVKPPQGSRSLEIVHANTWHGCGLAARRSGRGDGSAALRRARELIEASRVRWPDDPNVLVTEGKFILDEAEWNHTGSPDERMDRLIDEVVNGFDRLVVAFPQSSGYGLLAARARVVRAEKAVAAGHHASGWADADHALRHLTTFDSNGTRAPEWRCLDILARAYAARGRASQPPAAIDDLREACRLWKVVLARNPAQRSTEQAAEAAGRDLAEAQRSGS